MWTERTDELLAAACAACTDEPRCPHTPHAYLTQAVRHFFDHAGRAASEGKPLRFHFASAGDKAFVYGMIVCQDEERRPGRQYVVFVPSSAAAWFVAAELGAFNLRAQVLENPESVVDEDACFLVCVHQAAPCLQHHSFRVKFVDEAQLLWTETHVDLEKLIRLTIVADLTADFTMSSTDTPVPSSARGAGAKGAAESSVRAQRSWTSLLSNPYHLLWKVIIRPPRAIYNASQLGLTKFRFMDAVYERRDLRLTNPRGLKLECSYFFPMGTQQTRPCVIYAHGNCSCRLEVFEVLPVLLARGITVLCLDFAGCGWSEGEYISLGHYEAHDLRCAVEYLRESGDTSAIAIWGRSMGAAAAILHAAEDSGLSACVLDSPFSDLRVVIEEYVASMTGRYLQLPRWAMTSALQLLRTEVSSRASFDPFTLSPLAVAPRVECPALFGVAADDDFVLAHHAEALHNVWRGAREIRHFEGGHGGKRPEWFVHDAADFLLEQMARWANEKQYRGLNRRKAYVI